MTKNNELMTAINKFINKPGTTNSNTDHWEIRGAFKAGVEYGEVNLTCKRSNAIQLTLRSVAKDDGRKQALQICSNIMDKYLKTNDSLCDHMFVNTIWQDIQKTIEELK